MDSPWQPHAFNLIIRLNLFRDVDQHRLDLLSIDPHSLRHVHPLQVLIFSL